MPEDNQLRQEFFVTPEGELNIKLKFKTDDVKRREEIIFEIMGGLHRDNDVVLKNEEIEVTTMWLKNHDPKSWLAETKKQVMEQVSNTFDEAINLNS